MPVTAVLLWWFSSLRKWNIQIYWDWSISEKMLAAVGNPQKGLPFIHIAGTNGKGSTAAFLRSVLTEAGYRTGMYTSPHLEDFRERFSIDGEGRF